MFSFKTLKNLAKSNLPKQVSASPKPNNTTSKELLFALGATTAYFLYDSFKNPKNVTAKENTQSAEVEDNIFTQFKNLNEAIDEKGGNSYTIGPVKISKCEFRGSLSDYIKNQAELSHITAITLTGEQVRPGIFDSSVILDPEKFSEFMRLIDEAKVRKLDLTFVHLTRRISVMLGRHLKTNTALEELSVTTNQLEHVGICMVLHGIADNDKSALKKLTMRSYNVTCYYFDTVELSALQRLIATNRSLELIDLPDNQIQNPEDLQILMKPYLSNPDHKLATIRGLELNRSVGVPDINQENIANDIVQQCSEIRFRKPWE